MIKGRKMAEKIISQNANYFLTLKGNQGSLHADVKDFFKNTHERSSELIDFHESLDNE
jgi:hypothetical protein